MDRKVRTTFSRVSRSRTAKFTPGFSSYNNYFHDVSIQDDELAPVMPAIDAVQLLEEQNTRKENPFTNTTKNTAKELFIDGNLTPSTIQKSNCDERSDQKQPNTNGLDQGDPVPCSSTSSRVDAQETSNNQPMHVPITKQTPPTSSITKLNLADRRSTTDSENNINNHKLSELDFTDSSCEIVNDISPETSSSTQNNNPLESSFARTTSRSMHSRSDDYEFIPKSSILDIYSNDPEVKRFLKQLTRIANEYGYDEQDYKCQTCRRPIGMVFGQSRLCHFDGHHYCNDCHLGEKAVIPARILCNWDFNKYPISKRNQHLLSLISNEPMFELKTIAPLLYDVAPELVELDQLRRQAFFIRSYCFTCAQDSVSFELTKQIWPREHLIKQIDLYSIEDLIQVKSGTLKNLLKNAITFGKEHVLSCMLCCFKGFFCELCKCSQIIYPFDTDTVQRCDQCQSIFHKTCFEKQSESIDPCPRCRRLRARQKTTTTDDSLGRY